MTSVFKFSTDTTSIEVEGSEEFLLEHISFLAPWVRRVTGADAPSPGAGGPRPGAAAPAAAGIEGVAHWWYATVPEGMTPSIQDTILLFAYFMRGYRKTVFQSEDIRRCFLIMSRSSGMEEPRSLLQILGNLRREHGLLLNAGRRGEYMMNTTGIARAREILGERRTASSPEAPARGAPIELGPLPARKQPDVRSIFKD